MTSILLLTEPREMKSSDEKTLEANKGTGKAGRMLE